MAQFTRYFAVSALLLSSMATEAAAASLYTTPCGSLTGTAVSDPAVQAANVEIVARLGTPPSSGMRRREHVEISAGLAAALGITTADLSLSGESRQVRVTLGSGSPIPTANLTVAAIDVTDPGLRLGVWLPDDLDPYGGFEDTDNGFFKLFGTADPEDVFAASPRAKVYSVAPGTTVVVEGGVATRYVHFNEPNSSSSKGFRECVEIRNDERLAVLVPHGGGIETKISGELPTLLSALAWYGYRPSVWESSGQWGGGSTFQRWHVTSGQISGESFPGYGELEAGPDYQFAIGLHGFSGSGYGVVFGGQASRQVKCYLVAAIETWLFFNGGHDGRITYKIFAPDGPAIDVVRYSTGPGDNPKPLKGVGELDGISANNIVNRISPNPSGARGYGGIQAEMSRGLREDTTLFPEFFRGLAYALDGQLRYHPVGDYCAQFE